jgi:hypothetical protein
MRDIKRRKAAIAIDKAIGVAIGGETDAIIET